MTSKAEKKQSESDTKNISVFTLLGSQDECPICLETFDLVKKIPMMICLNQHSSCQQCLKDVYSKHKCPVCQEQLIRRLQVKKNRIICSLIEEMIKANGEQYIECPKFKYRGKVKKGKRNGYGEQINESGHFYKGFFKNGQLFGQCEVLTKQGAKFEGQAVGGKLQGKFTTKFGSSVEGKFEMQSLSGVNCMKKYTNGDKFQGNIKALKAEGFGTLTLKNGNSFEGQFIKDYIEPNGRAKISGTFDIELKNQRIQIRQLQQQMYSPRHDEDEDESYQEVSAEEDSLSDS